MVRTLNECLKFHGGWGIMLKEPMWMFDVN